MLKIYSAIFYCLLPLVLLRLLGRSFKAPAYARRWSERFGHVAPVQLGENVIWLHAVSVGETIASAPLVKALLESNPDTQILFTTTTPTGSDQVQKLFQGEMSAGKLVHRYSPYDLPHCVNRFLDAVKPQVLIVMETEIWPNSIAACKQRKIPTILANGRLSEKSARGYKKVAWLIRPTFQTLIAVMQYEADALRAQQLGVLKTNCSVSGNIKFDLTIDDDTRQKAAELKAEINQSRRRIVWLAASTHKGEDKPVIEAYLAAQKECPELLLILVPRHPERFESVVELCLATGLKTQRRSAMKQFDERAKIVVGDTMGELLTLYGVADFVFVGGSLVNVGGHNLMEPAAWGLPIVTGPHLYNFSEASRLLVEAGSMKTVFSQEELAQKVILLGKDSRERMERGDKALAVAENNRGALEKLLKVISVTVQGSQE